MHAMQRLRCRGRAYQRSTAGGYIGSDGDTSYFFDPKTGASVMTENQGRIALPAVRRCGQMPAVALHFRRRRVLVPAQL